MRFWTRAVSMGMAKKGMRQEILNRQNECGFLTNGMQEVRGMTTKCLGCVNKGEGRIRKFKIQNKGEGKSDLGKEMNSIWTRWVYKTFRTYSKPVGNSDLKFKREKQDLRNRIWGHAIKFDPGKKRRSPEEKRGEESSGQKFRSANCCEQAGGDTPLMQAFIQLFELNNSSPLLHGENRGMATREEILLILL